jgi:hypothetical protein
MKRILKKEKRDDRVSAEAREKIIELADGSPGQALKLLDQIIDMKDSQRALNTLRSAGGSDGDVTQIVRILTHYDMPPNTKWSKIRKILKEYKGDGESVRRPILGYMNSALLNKGGDRIFFMMQPFKKNFFDTGKAGLTMACYESIFFSEDE